MTTMELNAEIYQNLGYLADSEDYMKDVLRYLKKLTLKKKKAAIGEAPSDTHSSIVITPRLQDQLDKAREEYKNGETLHFDTVEEMHKWMDAL